MSAITARDMIKDALLEIRVLGVGQSVNVEVEQRAFRKLNRMLELMSLDANKIYVDTEESETLTSGTSRYTVGSGGDFNTNRPLEIRDDAFIRDTGGIDHPIRVLSQDKYRKVPSKTDSARPRFMTYTPEFPLGKISLKPEPNDSTDVLHYRASVLLDSFATLTTSVNFAPGYEEAIILALAIAISSQNGKSVTQELAATAATAWETIERPNALRRGMETADTDELARMVGPARYGNNILTGPFV